MDWISEAEQILQTARRQKALQDPVSFAHAVGKPPDPWQEKVLQWQGNRLLLNCSRQAGKSTTTAVLATFTALTKPRSLIVLISPSERQSAELFRKVKEAYTDFSYEKPKLVEDNKLSMELANGSRIVALPASEDTIRGFSSVTLLIEDEAAMVPDAINAAVRPMLAVSGGKMILMSTPKGRRGHFFEAWERGGDAWTRIKATAKEIPRIAPKWLEEEREELYRRGLASLYSQEYECDFVNAAEGRVYGGFDETRNLVDELPKGATWEYLLGLDFGIVDQNACTVWAWRKHDPCVYGVLSYKLTATPSEMADEIRRLEQTYKFSRIVGDIGGMGKAFAEEARKRFSLPIEPADKHNKNGYIALLNGDLRSGRIKLVRSTCQELVDEWLELPWAENLQKEAAGFSNHAADSALYGWRAVTAYHEKPKSAGPKPGSEEWAKAEEARWLAADDERHARQQDRDWWVDE